EKPSPPADRVPGAPLSSEPGSTAAAEAAKDGGERERLAPPALVEQPAPAEDAREAPPIITRAPVAHSSRKRVRAQPNSQGSPALFPLVALNWIFDLYTFPLGPPGRWLRGPGGRTLLGAIGLVCWTLALTWGLVAWMGWTS